MAKQCLHVDSIGEVVPQSAVCEECAKEGLRSVALRLCLTCGHVGCCDSSPGQHARAHFNRTGHPIIMPYAAPKKWLWCYPDEMYLDPGAAKG